MSFPRGLSEEEAAAWEKLAATVRPLHPLKQPARVAETPERAPPPPKAMTAKPAGRKPIETLLISNDKNLINTLL